MNREEQPPIKQPMPKWKKIAIAAGIAFFALSLSFFIGGIFGFLRGYSYSLVRRASTEGLYHVMVLRDLREGRTEGAINLLETGLDSHIIAYSIREENCFRFDLYCITQYDMKFMNTIAKYRKEFPSRALDPEVRKRVEETLTRYESIEGK